LGTAKEMVATFRHYLALLTAIFFFSHEKVDGDRIPIKVGMLMPFNNEELNPNIGFSTSASAITIALDRIKAEHLLDQIDWEYVFYVHCFLIFALAKRDQYTSVCLSPNAVTLKHWNVLKCLQVRHKCAP
jgi:hypothetical protein